MGSPKSPKKGEQRPDFQKQFSVEDDKQPSITKQLTLEQMIQLASGGKTSEEPPKKEKDEEICDGKVRVPGPGAHDVPTTFSELKDKTRPVAPSWSMAGNWIQETTPEGRVGPGKYQPNEDATRPRAPGWGFGNRVRSKTKKKPQKQGGPALPQGDNVNFDRSPRYGFGSIDRFKPTPGILVLGQPSGHGRGCEIPGPGQHIIKDDATSKIATNPTYSFASPSFSYALANLRPSTTLGSRNGQKSLMSPGEKPSQFPGPGEYKISMGESHTAHASPRCKFGSSARMAANIPTGSSRTPGPDRYDTSSKLCTGHAGSSPQWSFGGRSKDHALDGHVL